MFLEKEFSQEIDAIINPSFFLSPFQMNESLRLTPTDINDWFMDCDNAAGDHKIPHVILNDKLMTDALLGTIPIKAEHSYSLTSDGDSIPDSPSDGTKIEGE